MAFPEGDLTGRMYASFHFSTYPLLYCALAERSAPKVVYSLIGEQQQGHRSALMQLSQRFGFQIEFIQSGPGMVRTLRRAIGGAMPGILLLDIPWTRSDGEPDVHYPVQGGRFKGHSSLERLLRLIDSDYEILFIHQQQQRFQIRSGGTLTLANAFSHFGSLLADDPADYERLHQFHKFFEFDTPRDYAVTFRVQQQRYVIHTRTMQAWQVADADEDLERDTVADAGTTQRFSREIRHELEHLVSI